MSGIPKLEFTKIGVLWLARYREYNLRIDAPAPWNNRRYGISIYKPNPTLVRLHWQGDFKSLEAAQQYGQEWLEAYLAGLASERAATRTGWRGLACGQVFDDYNRLLCDKA